MHDLCAEKSVGHREYEATRATVGNAQHSLAIDRQVREPVRTATEWISAGSLEAPRAHLAVTDEMKSPAFASTGVRDAADEQGNRQQ